MWFPCDLKTQMCTCSQCISSYNFMESSLDIMAICFVFGVSLEVLSVIEGIISASIEIYCLCLMQKWFCCERFIRDVVYQLWQFPITFLVNDPYLGSGPPPWILHNCSSRFIHRQSKFSVSAFPWISRGEITPLQNFKPSCSSNSNSSNLKLLNKIFSWVTPCLFMRLKAVLLTKFFL